MQTLQDYRQHCNRCDRLRYLVHRVQDHAHARPCEACFDPCPVCFGAEYTTVRDEQGYRYARRCPVCGPLKQRITAFNDARLPARYAQADFLSFQIAPRHGNNPPHAQGAPMGNLAAIRNSVSQWAFSYGRGERGYLLHGLPGCGKTHLLSATVRYLTLEKGVHARFIEFTHLLSQIRQQFDQGRGDNTVLGPLTDVEVLAIDELGKGLSTEWQLSVLDELISKRYNQDKTTLFTTNLPLEHERMRAVDLSMGGSEFRERAERETLRERVGDRIFSRLYEMTQMMHIDAPDYRRRA